MYLCVLLGLYLHFLGEDEGTTMSSSRTCLSVGQLQRWGFKEKAFSSNSLCTNQDSVALRLWDTSWIPQIWRGITELEQVQGGRALIGMCVEADTFLRERRRPSDKENKTRIGKGIQPWGAASQPRLRSSSWSQPHCPPVTCQHAGTLATWEGCAEGLDRSQVPLQH